MCSSGVAPVDGPFLWPNNADTAASALAGSFVTLPLSSHTVANLAMVEKCVEVQFLREELSEGRWRVSVVKKEVTVRRLPAASIGRLVSVERGEMH